MTFCYILMAHTAPRQVEHTVRRIRDLSPGAHVLVRHATTGVFEEARLEAAGAAELRSRIRMLWGDWTLVTGALEALEHAVRTTDAHHVVLLSGQDYPIRDLVRWEQEVEAAGVDALVDVFPPLPEDWMYSWHRVSSPEQVPAGVRRVGAAAWRRIARPLRKTMLCYDFNGDPRWYLGLRRFRRGPIPVVKGSLWMTLSRAAVTTLLERDARDDDVREWFRHVRIPDESYLQSLIVSSPELTWMTCPTTHARFEFGNPNAIALDARELDLAATGPAAFARKLTNLDPEIVARADRLAARPDRWVTPVHSRTADDPRLTGPELRAGDWAGVIAALLASVPPL